MRGGERWWAEGGGGVRGSGEEGNNKHRQSSLRPRPGNRQLTYHKTVLKVLFSLLTVKNVSRSGSVIIVDKKLLLQVIFFLKKWRFKSTLVF